MSRLIEIIYDKTAIEQFFRKSVATLLEWPEFQELLPEELDYLTEWFVVFGSFSTTNELVNGKMPSDLWQLAWQLNIDPEAAKNDRLTSQHAEIAANQLLLARAFKTPGKPEAQPAEEAILPKIGVIPTKTRQVVVMPAEWRKLELIAELYRSSAVATFRSEKEVFLLKQISRTCRLWDDLLSRLNLVGYLEVLESGNPNPNPVVLTDLT